MANGLGLRRLPAVAGLAIACAAASPAQAQFMSGAYPVLVVPPPPAQGMVMPQRPKPKETRPVAPTPSNESAPQQLRCHYEGRTRVCE